MGYSASASSSSAATAAQDTSGFQTAGQYINFGAGTLSTPQENNLSAGSGTHGSTGSGSSNVLLWVAIGIGSAALLAVIATHVQFKG
jgi:hypothetical protein